MVTDISVVIASPVYVEIEIKLAKVTKLYLHTLSITVNGDVRSAPRVLSTRQEPFTSLADIYNHRDTIISCSNIDTLFYGQFDLIYLFDLASFNSRAAVRIFNVTNGNYTYSENVVLSGDSVQEL